MKKTTFSGKQSSHLLNLKHPSLAVDLRGKAKPVKTPKRLMASSVSLFDYLKANPSIKNGKRK